MNLDPRPPELPSLLWTAVAIHLAGVLLIAAVSYWIGALLAVRPLRKVREAHWSQRARLVHSTRCALLMFGGFAVGPAVGAAATVPPSLVPMPWIAYMTAISLAALLPVAAIAGWADAHISGQRLPWSVWLRSIASVWIVVYLPVLIAVGALFLMPPALDLRAIGVLAIVALLIHACHQGAALALGRRLGLVAPAPPRLKCIADRVSERTGIPARSVECLGWQKANAYAFPVTRAVLVTEPLLDVLDDDELEGVIAHELAHLAEPEAVVRLRRCVSFLIIAVPALRPVGALYGIPGIAVVLAALLAAYLLAARRFRSLEVVADDAGKVHEPAAGTYARALEKIYEFNLVPAVLPGAGEVHPHLYDRLVGAGIQPDYPRPAPPPRFAALGAGATCVLMALGLFVLLHIAPSLAVSERTDPPLLKLVAGMRTSPHELVLLADDYEEAGSEPEALLLYRAGAAADRYCVDAEARLALALLERRDCGGAGGALREAERRQKVYGGDETDDETLDIARKVMAGLCR